MIRKMLVIAAAIAMPAAAAAGATAVTGAGVASADRTVYPVVGTCGLGGTVAFAVTGSSTGGSSPTRRQPSRRRPSRRPPAASAATSPSRKSPSPPLVVLVHASRRRKYVFTDRVLNPYVDAALTSVRLGDRRARPSEINGHQGRELLRQHGRTSSRASAAIARAARAASRCERRVKGTITSTGVTGRLGGAGLDPAERAWEGSRSTARPPSSTRPPMPPTPRCWSAWPWPPTAPRVEHDRRLQTDILTTPGAVVGKGSSGATPQIAYSETPF